MQHRFQEQIFSQEDWGRQMRFIAGPRQCGKTTLAKAFLKQKNSSHLYYNWDDKTIRARYRADSNFFMEDLLKSPIKDPWLCFDEIHKVKNWKNILKSYFDQHEDKLHTIVTGSARLDLFRKSGDSLAGRYFLFQLLPITLAELSGQKTLEAPPETGQEFIESRLARTIDQKSIEKILNDLLRFSGFPEPLFKANTKFHRVWKRDYTDKIIYEDLRDLSQIQDLDSVASLLELLPTKTSNPLSINSLSEDLELGFATTKNYLRYLELSYLTFNIKPYSKKIKRSIKKSYKTYFFDWTRNTERSALFENYIACELRALCKYWNNSGHCEADLYFVRNKDGGKETDFLITIEKKPWLLIEAKLKSSSIDSHHYTHSSNLGNIPILQVNLDSDCIKQPQIHSFIAPAYRVF